jgi:hypothetical protein
MFFGLKRRYDMCGGGGGGGPGGGGVGGGHGDLSPGDVDAAPSAVGGSGTTGGNVTGAGPTASPVTGRVDPTPVPTTPNVAPGTEPLSGFSGGEQQAQGFESTGNLFGGWESVTGQEDPALSNMSEQGAFGFDSSKGARSGFLAGTLAGGFPGGLIGALMGGMMGQAQVGGDVGAGGYGPGDPDAGGGPDGLQPPREPLTPEQLAALQEQDDTLGEDFGMLMGGSLSQPIGEGGAEEGGANPFSLSLSPDLGSSIYDLRTLSKEDEILGEDYLGPKDEFTKALF